MKLPRIPVRVLPLVLALPILLLSSQSQAQLKMKQNTPAEAAILEALRLIKKENPQDQEIQKLISACENRYIFCVPFADKDSKRVIDSNPRSNIKGKPLRIIFVNGKILEPIRSPNDQVTYWGKFLLSGALIAQKGPACVVVDEESVKSAPPRLTSSWLVRVLSEILNGSSLKDSFKLQYRILENYSKEFSNVYQDIVTKSKDVIPAFTYKQYEPQLNQVFGDSPKNQEVMNWCINLCKLAAGMAKQRFTNEGISKAWMTRNAMRINLYFPKDE